MADLIRCHCGMNGTWRARIAIPAEGDNEPSYYIALPQAYCLPHRKAGIKPAEVMDEFVTQFVTERMGTMGLKPDFNRSWLEWSPWGI